MQLICDDLYDAALTICGMPNRNGGSSTSDTGAATIMRDGWQAAESRASDTAKSFKRAEREFMKLFLQICRYTSELDLKWSDVRVEFNRKNLANMQSIAQVLCELLNNDMVHPKIAYEYSGIPNAEEAYRLAIEYHEESTRKEVESLNVRAGGQDPEIAEHRDREAVPMGETA